MTTALLTCNINSIDEVYVPVKQTVPYTLHYFTENNMPFPLPNMDARMKGKYLKTQFHKFIEADYYIWIDGSIEVRDENFIADCIALLKDNDLVMTKHPQRKNVFDELEYIIEQMRSGDRYLLKRYVKQPLFTEYDFYKSEEMPSDHPLYQCSFFACKADMAPLMNYWWDLIQQYSNFDQSQFAFASWKLGVKIAVVEGNDYFIRWKHPKYKE